MRVLLRRSALGDVVLLGAVTGALHGVTVVTDRRYLSLAERLRGVRDVRPWPEVPQGEVIDLQGSVRSWRLAPGARRIRKRSLRRRVRLWTGLELPRPSVPALYGEACGVQPVPPPWFDLPRVPRDALALIPGAAWGPKRPKIALLEEAGRAWRGPVVVLGGPGEEEGVRALAVQVPGAEALVERGFARTLDALARTRVAVCGDTGLMHLAGACGAKVVAWFGPTHPSDGFFVYEGEALGLDLPCRPCALHRVSGCRRGDRACADLAPQTVIEAVGRCAGSS